MNLNIWQISRSLTLTEAWSEWESRSAEGRILSELWKSGSSERTHPEWTYETGSAESLIALLTLRILLTALVLVSLWILLVAL